VVVGGVPVVFKRRSIWTVTGTGPSTFGTQKVFAGVGCLAGATVSAGYDRIYFLGAGGISYLPLPFGGEAPVCLTKDLWPALFAGMTEPDWAYAAGGYDAVGRRYFLTVRLSGVYETLVWEEERGVLARWNLEAGCYAQMTPSGGALGMYAGWRGYLGLLESGLNEGVSLEGVAMGDVSGIATGGSVTTLEDTGASFGALAGVDVVVVDGAGNEYTGRVWWNTGTVLYFTVALGAAVENGWAYKLGPIEAVWRSARFTIGERWDDDFAVHEWNLLFESGGTDTALAFWSQSDAGVAVEETVDATARVVRRTGRVRGKEAQVGFRSLSGERTWELAAFGAVVQGREGK
jgi:hypothetical protein